MHFAAIRGRMIFRIMTAKSDVKISYLPDFQHGMPIFYRYGLSGTGDILFVCFIRRVEVSITMRGNIVGVGLLSRSYNEIRN